MRQRFLKLASVLLVVAIGCMAIPFGASASGLLPVAGFTAEALAYAFNAEDEEGLYLHSHGNGGGPGTAEIVEGTNTVRLLKDVGRIQCDWVSDDGEFSCDGKQFCGIWIESLSEDVTLDLNGHTIYDANIYLGSDASHTFTIEDSAGGGKIFAADTPYAAVESEGMPLVIKGGTFIGSPVPTHQLSSDEIAVEEAWYAVILYGTVRAEILGGTFIGGNGAIIEGNVTAGVAEQPGSGAILIGTSEECTIEKLIISGDTVIQGGGGTEESAGGCGLRIGSQFNDEPIVINGEAIVIDGAKISGGDGLVGGAAIYSDSAVSITLMGETELIGGSVGGAEIDVADGSVITDLRTPKSEAMTVSKSGVTVSAEAGVFPEGTEIVIDPITDGSSYQLVTMALTGKASQWMPYEIYAIVDGEAVQPDGDVTVTFAVPDDYQMDAVELYYINGKGKAEKLVTETDVDNKTITAVLTHFSIYAVADTAVQNEDIGMENTGAESPVTGNGAGVGMALLALLASVGILLLSVRKKESERVL